MCGERAGKHVYFARLPASQRLHHPAHLKKQPNTTKNEPHLAPRRGAAAHLARPPCAQIATPAAQRWPRRPWPSSCALWPRVRPCSTRRTHLRPDTVSQQVAHAVVCRPTAQVPAAQNVPRPSEAPTAAVLGGDAAPGCRTISPKAGTAAVCRPIDRLDVFWSRPCCPPGRPENVKNPANRSTYIFAFHVSPMPNAGHPVHWAASICPGAHFWGRV